MKYIFVAPDSRFHPLCDGPVATVGDLARVGPNTEMGDREILTVTASKPTRDACQQPKERIGSDVIDSPKIIVHIFGQKFSCMLDTGATTSVCSESIFLELKSKARKLSIIPACGLYCTTTIGRKRQRIKYQCMLPIKINEQTLEVIFMVIPNLAVSFIIGCAFLAQWNAVINFESSNLCLQQGETTNTAPFAEGDTLPNTERFLEDNIVDTFSVEQTTVYGRDLAMIRTLGEIGSSIGCENGLMCSECMGFAAVNQSSGSAQSINGGKVMQLNIEESNVMTILHDKMTAVDTLTLDQKSALL